jgi:hypothetical protein
LILKLPRERSVWHPQYLLASTWSSPKASLSVLVLVAIFWVVAKVRTFLIEAADWLAKRVLVVERARAVFCVRAAM